MPELKKMIEIYSRCAENKELDDLEVVTERPLSEFFAEELPPKVLGLLNLKKEDKILDAGCGSGRFLTYFSNLDAFVVGVDASSSMLKRAKKRTYNSNNIFLVQGDIMNLPFRHKSFDAVVSISTLQNLPTEKYCIVNEEPCKSAIKEFARVLKNDGQVIISFLNKYNIDSIQTILGGLFANRILKHDFFLYYTTIGKVKRWYENCDLKVQEVVARGFHFPFKITIFDMFIGYIYLLPKKYITVYLRFFEFFASFVNKHVKFLKIFGASFLIKGIKLKEKPAMI